MHSDQGADAGVLNSVTCTVSVPYAPSPYRMQTLFNLQAGKILADLKLAEQNLAEANWSAGGFQS